MPLFGADDEQPGMPGILGASLIRLPADAAVAPGEPICRFGRWMAICLNEQDGEGHFVAIRLDAVAAAVQCAG